MRIERISPNQFTIFLTFEDLLDRGFTKDDLWYDATKIRNLFSDMMYEASSELDFELEGELVVQVHLMQAQGLHVMVTQEDNTSDWEDDYIEMKVTLDESDELIFSFSDFEHLVTVSEHLLNLSIYNGSVYYFNQKYYLLLEDEDLMENKKGDIIAILSEYALPSILTSYRLLEYGKPIFEEKAVQQLRDIFL